MPNSPNRFRPGTTKLRPDEKQASRMKPGDRAPVALLALLLPESYGYPVNAGNNPVG